MGYQGSYLLGMPCGQLQPDDRPSAVAEHEGLIGRDSREQPVDVVSEDLDEPLVVDSTASLAATKPSRVVRDNRECGAR
jgi:hypothetical protein